jgi:hypothetical protein
VDEKAGEKLPDLKLLLLPDAEPHLSILEHPAPDTPITLLIGAEGGFDPLEIEAAHAAGFCPVQLGSRTLRTETASLDAHGDPYLLSVLDLSGQTGIDYGVYGVPESLLIDRQCVIRYKHIGSLTQEALKEKILPLVRKLEAEGAQYAQPR